MAAGLKILRAHLPAPTRKRLLFLVLGILLGRTVAGGAVRAASHERRLRRLLKDQLLCWGEGYAPTVTHVLKWQRAKRLPLLIDESGHSDVVRVLTAAVWYRNRAIPWAWVSWPTQQPTPRRYWDYVAELLDRVAPLLPHEPQIVVVADRTFGHPAFTDQVAARGWDWPARVQHQTCFRDARGRCPPLHQVLTGRGQRWRGQRQLFKQAGWETAICMAYWTGRRAEPLLLASSLPAAWELIALYRCRGAIETLLGDWKAAGGHWEASLVRERTHQERLLVGRTWATLVVLCLGEQVATDLLAQPARPRCYRSWHSRQSSFRLGLDRLQAHLYKTASTPPVWTLSAFDAPDLQQQLVQRDAAAFVMGQQLPRVA